MSREMEPRLSHRMRDAVGSLEGLIRGRYPDVSLRVSRNPEDSRSIDLLATLDVDDRDEVMDLVVERVLELQLKQKLPVHVVPLRTPKRTAAVIENQRRHPRKATQL